MCHGKRLAAGVAFFAIAAMAGFGGPLGASAGLAGARTWEGHAAQGAAQQPPVFGARTVLVPVDIRVTEKVTHTMVNGRLYDASNGDQLLPTPAKRGKFFWEN